MKFGLSGLVFNGLFALETYVGRERVDRFLGGVRSKNERRMLRTARRFGARCAPHRPVPEATTLDCARFQRDHARPGRPVVVRGLAVDTRAVRCWTPDYFHDRYGDLEVVTVDGCDRSIDDLDAGTGVFRTEQMTWGEQLRRMQAGGSEYLAFFGDVFEHDPTLADDLDPSRLRPLLGRRLFGQPIPKLFVGARGTSTQWHCAELQNLFIQVSGRKKWLMAAPSYTPCFDPRISSTATQYCHSMIDFRNPDVERYPLYEHVATYEVVLEPGDLLYVPPFWWHCVENLSDTVGVALWWPNVLPAIRGHATLAWLTVLSPQHLVRMARESVRGRAVGTESSTGSIFRRHSRRLARSTEAGSPRSDPDAQSHSSVPVHGGSAPHDDRPT